MLTSVVGCWPDYRFTLLLIPKMLVDRIWNISWSSWKDGTWRVMYSIFEKKTNTVCVAENRSMSNRLPSESPQCPSFLSLQCFYVPRCQKDSMAMHVMIMNISERLKINHEVPCYYDPSEQQETVLLKRLYDHSVIFHSLLWPSCMFTGGALIIMMVKLTQYLSRLCEEIGKIQRWDTRWKPWQVWWWTSSATRKGLFKPEWPSSDPMQTFLFRWDIWSSWVSLLIEDVTGYERNWMINSGNSHTCDWLLFRGSFDWVLHGAEAMWNVLGALVYKRLLKYVLFWACACYCTLVTNDKTCQYWNLQEKTPLLVRKTAPNIILTFLGELFFDLLMTCGCFLK